jgi:hypothetical protein
MKFNAAYYICEILILLVQSRVTQVRATDRRLIVHADNARPHTAKKVINFCDNNGLRKAPHSPYSPDLASGGFFLFVYIKETLERIPFDDGNQHLQVIDVIF